MLLTPLLLVAGRPHAHAAGARRRGQTTLAEIDEAQQAPVIIAGFGRYGQIVGRLMYANGIAPTVLDHNAEQIEALRRFGWRVFYGDATRLDLMRMAGAAEARVLVLAIDDVEQSLRVVEMAREHFPQPDHRRAGAQCPHFFALRELGVTLIERETLDSALMSGRSVLELLGWEAHQARNLALRFRKHTVAQLNELAPHWKDEAKLIAAFQGGPAATRNAVRAGARGSQTALGPLEPGGIQSIRSRSRRPLHLKPRKRSGRRIRPLMQMRLHWH